MAKLVDSLSNSQSSHQQSYNTPSISDSGFLPAAAEAVVATQCCTGLHCSPSPCMQPITMHAAHVQGCMWTDSCRIGGCEDRCIASTLTAGSRTVLRDRSVSEGSYLLCPQATFIHTVSLMVAAGLNRRRRLHSRPDQVCGPSRPSVSSRACVSKIEYEALRAS